MEWIKCSERMPDVDLNFSCEYLCSNGYAVFTSSCVCELIQNGKINKYFTCDWTDVTHWQEMPVGPRC